MLQTFISYGDRSLVFGDLFYGKAANNYDVTLTVTLLSHLVTQPDPLCDRLT
ncbi:hypothetical protein [Pseudanabaena minima]|uniref:hypothetical protein n=1 Tax=Pseudanabaena minima TaxID=890415 RepID=UPI003DA81573